MFRPGWNTDLTAGNPGAAPCGSQDSQPECKPLFRTVRRRASGLGPRPSAPASCGRGLAHLSENLLQPLSVLRASLPDVLLFHPAPEPRKLCVIDGFSYSCRVDLHCHFIPLTIFPGKYHTTPLPRGIRCKQIPKRGTMSPTVAARKKQLRRELLSAQDPFELLAYCIQRNEQLENELHRLRSQAVTRVSVGSSPNNP